MKYPKPWDAGSPAGKPFVASITGGGRRREGESNPRAGMIQFGTYVNRPGTPDHTRLVRTWLSLEEARRLVSELNHHIELVRKFNGVDERGVVEQMIANGSIGTGTFASNK